MAIRPIDIARKLGISTTTLRTYEELGLAPSASRSATGYRVYTDEHMAYFTCAREMLPGFTLKQISEIFKEVMAKKISDALWMANKSQADLHQEKVILEKIIQNLIHKNISPTNKKLLTINDVSRETGVPATTIRHWDKVGLILAERSVGNNYRMFSPEHIKQVLTIYALKFSVRANRYKHSIGQIKEQLEVFDYNDRNRIETMTNDIELYLDSINRAQISGITALYRLCVQVEKDQFGC